MNAAEIHDEEADEDTGFWTAVKNEQVYASTACYGFRGRYWEAGERTVVDIGEVVPVHFERVNA